MAKLKNLDISARSADGTSVEFTSKIAVDRDGTFTASFDTSIIGALTSLAEKTSPQLTVHQSGFVSGKSLEAVENCLRMAARHHIECAVDTEFVILYTVRNQISYVLDDELGVVPNGTYGKHNAPTNWKGGLHSGSNVPVYSIGFGASVYTKRTFHRGDGDSVVYERTSLSDFPQSRILSEFAGLNVPEGSKGVKEIPFSVEAAEFFRSTLLGMCQMAEAFDSFFKDDARVIKAIKTGALPLLAAPSVSAAGKAE